MSSFTVRVQLKDSIEESDYHTLHKAMLDNGFERTIVSNGNITYKLPKAEYNLSGSFDKSEVLDLAKNAVQSTSKSAEILVTESAGRTWFNLSKVE